MRVALPSPVPIAIIVVMIESMLEPPVTDRGVALMALMKLKGVGRRGALRLLLRTPERFDASGLCEIVRSTRSLSELSGQVRDSWSRAADQLHGYADMGIYSLGFFDDAYPVKLRAIPDPPAVLFVKGSIAGLHTPHAIAVVGTREPTAYGAKVARRSAASASEAGFVIVSGLALGCDTAGHEGCLDVRGTGVVVLAQGLDRVYPAANRELAERLLEGGGCLVSEYPIGVAPTRSAFVERDRIQSGLSDAVLVIETDVVGGTMHTVRFSQEQGRSLACIQHPVQWQSEAKTRGNQKLIAAGEAVPIADGEALSAFLTDLKTKASAGPAPAQMRQSQLEF